MAHRHVLAVDRAGLFVAALVRCEVGDDLVAVEVEVHPLG